MPIPKQSLRSCLASRLLAKIHKTVSTIARLLVIYILYCVSEFISVMMRNLIVTTTYGLVPLNQHVVLPKPLLPTRCATYLKCHSCQVFKTLRWIRARSVFSRTRTATLDSFALAMTTGFLRSWRSALRKWRLPLRDVITLISSRKCQQKATNSVINK